MNMKEKKQVKHHVNEIIEIAHMELQGGIYFKLLCIGFNLIEIMPLEDHTFLIEFLMG